MKEVYQSYTSSLYNIHDAIIQTLDRLLGYDSRGYPQFYPANIYEAALPTVNNADVIYSPAGIHPDFYDYDLDPAKAIADVGAKRAGKILQPYVDRVGHPVVKGTLALDPDENIEQLISTGKLSMSTSVAATYDDMGNCVNVRFQNLLIFPEIPGGPVVPGDQGTIFLNTKKIRTPNMTEQQGGAAQAPIDQGVVSARLDEIFNQFTAFRKESDELKAQLAASKDEFNTQMTKKAEEFKTQIEAKEAELTLTKEAMAQFTRKLEEDKAVAKEREFQSMIHDPLFPPGMLKGDDAEELLRQEFTESPAQFTRKVLSVYVNQNAFLEKKGGEQGQQFSKPKGDSKWDTDEGRMILGKLGLKREQMGA
jgi:molecular chaperone GrpE (heat shock protein)